MNNPEYIKIDDKVYKINTDFRCALKCLDIVNDKSITDLERTIGVLYTLFQIEDDIEDVKVERLLKSALNYLQGRPTTNGSKDTSEVKKDMDYKQDWGLILSSVWQQYGIDLNKEKLHWWTFFDLLNGLSSDCMFNRIREIRNKDLSDIKDEKTRREYMKLKKAYSLDEHRELTEKEQQSVDTFYKLTGIERKW